MMFPCELGRCYFLNCCGLENGLKELKDTEEEGREQDPSSVL